jgi:predicted GH43/DUF377 family glycosyl hydrolase
MGLHRHPDNPVLTRADIPDHPPGLVDVSSVFNPGATAYEGGVLLLARVQDRGRETHLVRAVSEDGLRFRVDPGPVPIHGLERAGRVHHAYDPRITRIDGRWLVTLALDRDDGCRIGLASTEDFRALHFLGILSEGDSRNGVLFPERIGGRYAMLERPNLVHPEGGPPTGDAIVLSLSDDLARWQHAAVVAQGRPRYWDERIGPGTPPVKTTEGWLLLYHGVATHFAGVNIYQAGALLLDLADPSHVLARTRYNILEPREAHEMVGQVPNVVFPSGWVVDDLDQDGFARPESRVLVYYGAADTCVGAAFTTIGELLRDCREGA